MRKLVYMTKLIHGVITGELEIETHGMESANERTDREKSNELPMFNCCLCLCEVGIRNRIFLVCLIDASFRRSRNLPKLVSWVHSL